MLIKLWAKLTLHILLYIIFKILSLSSCHSHSTCDKTEVWGWGVEIKWPV